MAVAPITKAYLNNNIAYFEVLRGPVFGVGMPVTVAGATTAAFNGSYTVLQSGLFQIPRNGQTELWSGFAVSKVNANIPAEVETITKPGEVENFQSAATVTF
jgi:hypothetical protein